jgi:peroxiredoxin
MSEVEKEIQDYKLQFIEKNPDFLISKVFIAAKDPDVPEAPILSNGRKDSLFQYNYYKANFFENMDFSDDRLLRTPVFYNRLNFYMEKVVIQIPDSIIKESDKLIEKGRGNDEVFKYLVWYFTHTYETSDIMGFDAVFVHTVENYYMTGQAVWVSPTILENLTNRAMKLKPILIGKIAPNLIMQDTSLNLQALHAVKAAYTVLYFWDPECGHCGVDLPKFHRYYLENKEELDFEVFCVCTDTNWVEMKKFIRKHNLTWINVNGPRAATKSFADLYDIHSTPVMFILDEKKAIIAKRLGSEKVDSFIKSHRKMKAEMRD